MKRGWNAKMGWESKTRGAPARREELLNLSSIPLINWQQ